MLASSAWAQDFERIAPKVLPHRPASDLPSAPTPTVPVANAPLIEKLHAIVLVAKPEAVQASGVSPTPQGLVIQDLPLLERADFRAKLTPYLGQTLTESGLSELNKVIVVYCRERRRPVVEVIVPEQDVTSGVLQLLVVEGRLGKIRVESGRWFNAEQLRSQLRIQPGEVIESRKIMTDLDWINRNPFRPVDIVYGSGENFGETDLIVRPRDRFPVRFYTGYEDSGTDLTGDERWLGGFNWGNAFGLDGQLNYQFTTSSDFQASTTHSAVYVQPLPWRHILTVFGSYGESEAQFNKDFNIRGLSWQSSMRYEIPLPIWGPLHHAWSTGFDFKQTNNNLAFGGKQVFDTTTDVAQFVWAYQASAVDAFGESSFRGQLFYSPGDWTDNAKKPNYQAQRSRADPEYVYGNIEIGRVTRLPWQFTASNKMTFQWSEANLLVSEQLGLGGYASVRGYEEREVNSDQGWILNNELRLPPFSLGQLVGLANAQDQLQFLGFWDYAVGSNRFRLRGENPTTELSGVGPGLRFTFASYLSVRADYGFQLLDTGFNKRNNGRWHLGITFSY
jgi:hemolysin activation/secretion protein